jgi:hypothetical protein
MENKSTSKYYLWGLGAIVIIIAIVMLSGGSKPSVAPSQTESTTNAPITNTPSTPATNPASASSGLMGTWVSSVSGKGMQGAGKVTLNGTTDQIAFTGDINLVVTKVENNSGTGTITFSNICLTVTVSTSGKPDVANPTQCLKAYSQAAVMKIDGNNISYTGETVLGANVVLTGTFSGNSMTGTFIRKSSSGSITGTFSLIRKG